LMAIPAITTLNHHAGLEISVNILSTSATSKND
jgi:hypothetical protein